MFFADYFWCSFTQKSRGLLPRGKPRIAYCVVNINLLAQEKSWLRLRKKVSTSAMRYYFRALLNCKFAFKKQVGTFPQYLAYTISLWLYNTKLSGQETMRRDQYGEKKITFWTRMIPLGRSDTRSPSCLAEKKKTAMLITSIELEFFQSFFVGHRKPGSGY